MASKTKDRILATALALFNEHGFGAVTNEMLADALGIRRGNVWYHFKTKRDLLEALSERFVEDMAARIAIRPTSVGDIMEEYAAILRSLDAELRQYRFIYRDRAEYGQYTSALEDTLLDLHKSTVAQFYAFYATMIDQKLLDLSKDRLDLLVTAVIMLLRYHLEYMREAREAQAAEKDSVESAIELHLFLFEDRLTKSAARNLRKALKLPRSSA